MPPIEARPVGRSVFVILTVLAVIPLAYVAFHPLVLLFAVAAIGLVSLVMWLLDLRLVRRARARSGEHIGTFALALDRRSPDFDPWVVRAVWDALAPWTSLHGDIQLPLRPTDVIADLGCVGSDVEDVFVEAATRARRSTVADHTNPYYGRVSIVGDLVRFIAHQPRAPAA